MMKNRIINDFIANSIPKCVKRNIGNLGESLSQMFEKKFFSIITNRIHQWKECNFTTLNDMIIAIKNDYSEQISKSGHDYICVIHNWLVEKVGADIAIELKALCEKFGVTKCRKYRKIKDFSAFLSLQKKRRFGYDYKGASARELGNLQLLSVDPVTREQ